MLTDLHRPQDLATAPEFFRSVLRHEAEALGRASDRLDATKVAAAISIVLHCDGKLVLLGVGKSGLIARKIASTFVSIGVPAIFVHPGDALHGDLGLLDASDVVVLISNSGETEELRALLPHLRLRKARSIGIVGRPNSSLAKSVDVYLDAAVDEEACPLNLAPTASTTLALALGDGLAMAVAKERGLSMDEFAMNHPAGTLGKRLTLRVCDLMDHDQEAKVGPDDSWRELVICLSSCRLGAVNVASQDGSLRGLVTDGDLRRALLHYSTEELDSLVVSDLMTSDPRTISPDALAVEALDLMTSGDLGLHVLPVVADNGDLRGLLRLQDLVRAGL